ncbi:MAG: glycosyltransferase, partial [Gemmatimonadota bacterium]
VRANWGGGRPPVLVLVGDGPDRSRLEQVIRAVNLTDGVILAGWRSDVSRFLGAFDLFVLSSDSEGTSVSLLEAMAAGVPPVATAVGGNPAVIGPLMKDQLVPPQDPAALASVIAGSLQNPGRADRLRHLAPERVAAEFGLARMIGEYEQLYTQLLEASS